MKKAIPIVKEIFNTENKILRVCERILDLACLNLLFLLTSLPIITIGIAKMSLYQTLDALHGERKLPIFTTYMTHFKRAARLGLVMGMMEIAIFSVVVVDMFILSHQEGAIVSILKVICFAMMILSVLFSLVSYPLTIWYRVTMPELLKTSLLYLAFRFGTSLVLFLVWLLLVGVLLSLPMFFVFGMLFLLVIGFALLAYAQLLFMKKRDFGKGRFKESIGN